MKKILILIALVHLLLIALIFAGCEAENNALPNDYQTDDSQTSAPTQIETPSPSQAEVGPQPSPQPSPQATPQPTTQPSAETKQSAVSASRYLAFSQAAFDSARDKKRVYFFHAPWCPTCKAANAVFESQQNQIPEGVVLFKTDYDSSAELKKKFGITYQHTFVLVDADGNEIKKWNGGDMKALLSNVD